MIYYVQNEIANRENPLHVDWIEEQDYHVDSSFSFRFSPEGVNLKPDVRLPVLKFIDTQSPLDFLNSGMIDGNFMIFSKRAVEIFQTLKIADHSLIDLQIDNYEYSAVHFDAVDTQSLINWEESTFQINKESRELFQFKNLEDFLSNFRSLAIETRMKRKYKIYELKLNSMELDFFLCRTPLHGRFCSEKMRNLILENNLTGFRFTPITEMHNVRF